MPLLFSKIIQDSAQPGPDHIPSWQRFGSIVLTIVAVFTWLASASTLIGTTLIGFAHAALDSQRPLSWEDIAMTGPAAVLFVGASMIARDFMPAIKILWNKLEDMLGRVIVIAHSATHTVSGRAGNYLRRVLAFLAVSVTLCVELVCLKLTFGQLPHLSSYMDRHTSFINLVGNPYTYLFSLLLTLSCAIALLLIRYTVSAKWQAIYNKPQFKEGLPANSSQTPNVRILHASDFHITDTDIEPLTEGGQPFAQTTLTALVNAIAQDANACDAFLVTGDTTDTGSCDAWMRFLKSCTLELRQKMILVPGNHDLNLQDHRLALKAEKPYSEARRARMIRMTAAMAEVMGDRAYLLDPALDRLFTLKQYLERHEEAFSTKGLTNRKPGRGFDGVWNALFPMVVEVGNERNGKRLGVLVLNSVKPSSLGLTNAIGTLPPEVLEKCSALMNRMANRCDSFVVALHHHVAMPTGGNLFERIQNSGLVLENASSLIDMLEKRGDPTVVFHGHRHKTYTGVASDTDVVIIASPSASIGPGGVAGKGSWRIVDLFCSDAGCRVVDSPDKRDMNSPSLTSRRSPGKQTQTPVPTP